MKAIIEHHLANFKLERNDAANMAYIHSFFNAIWDALWTNLDLEGIRAQMREMLLTYMRNNPICIKNHLPLKDLVTFGMNFDFLPEGANFYDPDELLRMVNVPVDFDSEAEEEDDSGGAIEDAGPESG